MLKAQIDLPGNGAAHIVMRETETFSLQLIIHQG